MPKGNGGGAFVGGSSSGGQGGDDRGSRSDRDRSSDRGDRGGRGSSSSGGGPKIRKIFLGGLPPDSTEENITEFFGQYGPVSGAP